MLKVIGPFSNLLDFERVKKRGVCGCIVVFIPVILLLMTAQLQAKEKKNAKLSQRDSTLYNQFFENNNLLEFTLNMDFNALVNDTGKERKYHKGSIKYINERGQEQEVKVKAKTRGKFRLNKQNCDFPPLKFKFSNANTKGTLFAGQNKLKLVSHCQNSIESYDQHTLEEYLVYRIYNLISKNSFRVRLVKINYVALSGEDTLTRFGFFLEDLDHLAKRCNKSVMKFKNVKQYDVLRQNMVMLSLFQLMIGNSDWSVERLHNIDLISVDENSLPVALPFDFDWSAIINHPYYVQDPHIDPNAKYQRIYKGYQWSKDEFERAFEKYQKLKDPIFELIAGFQYLSDQRKERYMNYISEFYEIISSKKDVRNMMMKNSPKVPK